MWQGDDAYIIGGGPSLAAFDWELIRGKNTIGCNSAFILGSDVVKVLIFGDYQWWENIGRDQLPAFGGIVVGCSERLNDDHNLPRWVLTMDRHPPRHKQSWLGTTSTLGWYGNTGGLAINLALILGARRVFLLGFDMKEQGARHNWHDLRFEAGLPAVYPNFKRQLAALARHVPLTFPGREVVNVSNVSELEAFPKVSLEDHFGALKGMKP